MMNQTPIGYSQRKGHVVPLDEDEIESALDLGMTGAIAADLGYGY